MHVARVYCISITLVLWMFSLATAAPRNVLLLISDDQGRDAGCYGNQDVHTPAIDKLASQGVRFTQAFAAVSSCSPSRAVIQTGMYNHANGQYGLAHEPHNQRTRHDVQSLPAILGKRGYVTGIVGKYHLYPDEAYPFDERVAPNAGRDPKILAARVRDFITSAGTTPFFLTVGFGDPHRAGGGFPKSKPDSGETTEPTKPPSFLPDLPEIRADYARYCESVNNLDRCVSAVMKVLDESPAASSTLVIFVSDNGIPFPGAKTNLYDAGILLPLILRGPGIKGPSSTCDTLVSWVDIAPTVLEWAGMDRPKNMHGWSLLTAINDPVAFPRDTVFASHTFHEITMYYPMRCVRTQQYKLIWNLASELPFAMAGDIGESPSWKALLASPQALIHGRPLQAYLHRPRFELYDVTNDPDETRNLAEMPEHAETLLRLRNDLLTMMRETRDPWFQTARSQAMEVETTSPLQRPKRPR